MEISSIILFAVVVRYGSSIRIGSKASTALGSIAAETYFIYLFHQQIGFVFIKSLINHGVNCNFAVLIAFIMVAGIGYIHNRLSKQINLLRRKTELNI